MTFTLVGWSESQDSAVLINIAALADDHVRVVVDDITVPELSNLAGYYFVGANFTQGQIRSPSLRDIFNIDAEPADVAAVPASPAAFHDLFENPIPLEATEGLRAQMAEDAAGASQVTALAWLSDGPVAPVTGEMRTILANGTTATAAFVWTNCALTFSQTIPAGSYQVVGMRVQGATAVAARLNFTGAFGWRPGVVAFDADGDLDVPRFRNGQAGVFGEFTNETPPSIDILTQGIDAAQTVHLDVIKTA